MIERRHVAHIGHAPRLAAALLIAVAVAACSGDDDASTTTADSTAPTAASTSAAPVTTDRTTASTAATTPSTTAPPVSSTTPPTPPPSSTTPTSSTTEADVIAEVTAAAFAYDDWYVECLRKPADCDPSEVAVAGSDAFRNLTSLAAELDAGGLFVGPEDPGYMVIEGTRVDAEQVLVSVCGWGTMVLYGPPGPDGAPTVQNDTPSTVRETWQFVRDAGEWRLQRTDTLSEVEEVNECPPES